MQQNHLSVTKIRAACLAPYSEGWPQPEPAEVREVLRIANLTGSEAALKVGLKKSGGRTVRRWTAGAVEGSTAEAVPIPYAAWAILCECAGLGLIWHDGGKREG